MLRSHKAAGTTGILLSVALVATMPSQSAKAEEHQRQIIAPKHSHGKELSREFRDAARHVVPSVVLIESLRGPRETPQWRLHKERLGHLATGKHLAIPAITLKPRDERGSGIIIDSSGIILTCHHVVAGADVIFITLPDGRRFEPLDVRSDPEGDLAVLRIDTGEKLSVASLGDSDDLELGDWVVSVGNPYGLERSVSIGTVSATDRVTSMSPTPLIQSDASSNPGSSGGALANLQGEIIGVLAGSIGVDEGFQGVGLAVPINAAKQVADELLRTGTPERGYFGCDLQPIPPTLARQLELPEMGGLYVMYVAENTPASKANLMVGDLITHCDGEAIDSKSLQRHVGEQALPDVQHSMTVFRNGKAENVSFVMGRRPKGEAARTGHSGDHDHHPPQAFCKRFGLCVEELIPDTSQKLGYEVNAMGVLITDVEIGGIAYKDGVAAGMIVLRVNDHDILTKEDFAHVTNGLARDKPVLMLIESPDRRYLTVLGN